MSSILKHKVYSKHFNLSIHKNKKKNTHKAKDNSKNINKQKLKQQFTKIPNKKYIVSECIDNSHNFKDNFLRKLNFKSNTLNKDKDKLEWLKKYVYNQAQDIVENNFNQFKNLFDLFNSLKIYNFIIKNTYQIKYNKPAKWMGYKLENELKKYPNRYLPSDNREFIINSLTQNKTVLYTSFSLTYSFNNILGAENLEGNITFNCKFKDAIKDGSQYVNNIIYTIIKIIGFYVKYTITKNMFSNKLPNIIIYFTDVNKCLHKDDKVLDFSVINSAFYYNNNDNVNSLIIYRQQELFKILIHELQHFYRIDLTNFDTRKNAYSLNDLISNFYNVKRIDDKYLNINESYTEMNATILNTIFSTHPFNKINLINNFYQEMLFSLYQLGKLFNYQKIPSSLDIYSNKSKDYYFHQKSFIFEYYYLKAKLLFQFNDVLKFINDTKYYSEKEISNNNLLINIVFPKINSNKFDQYLDFGNKLLINVETTNWDKALDVLINEYHSDINLRMTKLELPLYNSKIKIKFISKFKTF
jgi:hypothetical protein